MLASRDTLPLLAELLAEQQRLDTPVARFAEGPGRTPRQLIPLTRPNPGEQYAFEVDLDSCTGCKSCVAACHSLNGLDEDETWRDVGVLVSSEPRHPFAQTITSACHHCADPACLNGCPVLAYEKDPVTGIVRHLDDQCIGCSYCVLKCPYDVPKYSSRLGIVRKCDMCHGRLTHGEAPACAQACPTGAIRIVTVPIRTPFQSKEAGLQDGPAANPSCAPQPPSAAPVPPFLPGAPDPSYTRPTTRYVTNRRFPAELTAGDADALQVQPTHGPLVALLTLMPLAVGCSVVAATFEFLDLAPAVTHRMALTGAVAGFVGLMLSVLHLGRPERAWRVFLGLRRSWLSREAVAFGLWAPLALATAAHGAVVTMPSALAHGTAGAAAGVGLLALFCSVMIYVDTRRRLWRITQALPRFFGTAAVLALAVAIALGDGDPAAAMVPRVLPLLLAVVTFGKLAIEAQVLVDADAKGAAEAKTARLLRRPLRPLLETRVACALVGGIALPLALACAHAPSAVAWLALALVALGETSERILFFRAVDAPKMPGMPGPA